MSTLGFVEQLKRVQKWLGLFRTNFTVNASACCRIPSDTFGQFRCTTRTSHRRKSPGAPTPSSRSRAANKLHSIPALIKRADCTASVKVGVNILEKPGAFWGAGVGSRVLCVAAQ